MDEKIKKKVIEIIADEIGINILEIRPESGLMDDLGMNSIEVMSSISKLEKEYSVRIPEKSLRYFVTVEDVIYFISENKDASQS